MAILSIEILSYWEDKPLIVKSRWRPVSVVVFRYESSHRGNEELHKWLRGPKKRARDMSINQLTELEDVSAECRR